MANSDLTATYSPDDNKLRLYSCSRLDSETYQRVKAAGFKWAPKQDLFVAPMWTPNREDFLLAMCGEIGDEDTSLVERSEVRAERFEDYSDKRGKEADAERQGVAAITENIPFGQPILIGHHSEKRARKDAERIQNGMGRAVKLWETSEYWQQRAAGALGHAKYKESAPVRARRIKKIEADKRRHLRSIAESEKFLKVWTIEGLTLKQALGVANFDHISRCFPLADYPRDQPASQYEGSMSLWSAMEHGVIDEQQARDIAIPAHNRSIAWSNRWIAHFDNRLSYEKAMLEAQGGADLLKPKPRKKQLPLCNYRVEDGLKIENMYHKGEMIHYPQVEMTKAEYSKINKDYKGTRVVDRSHRVRTAMVGCHNLVCIFLTDSKVNAVPVPVAAVEKPVAMPRDTEQPKPIAKAEDGKAVEFEALKDQLAAGVQVVSAPQLFPTPMVLAERMVELASVEKGHRVLEPSAGTGNILRAIREATGGGAVRTAVEIDYRLCDKLRVSEEGAEINQGNFLEYQPVQGSFDRIIMNPPFTKAQDIKHIRHAVSMLKPGGRLIAICANGPRQNDQLRPLVDECGGVWEDLPANTFTDSGTSVNTALITINA